MKKLISLILCGVMLCPIFAVSACAKADGNVLKADENGEFRILQVSDVQEHFTTDGKKHIRLRTLNTIKMAVKTLNPDLIVLTGDNIHRCESLADFDYSVKKLTQAFGGVPFAVTYGNHDLERNKDNGECLTYKQEQAVYDKYGAVALCKDGLECSDTSDYSTSYYGTGYIDVYSTDGTQIANRIILINSGTYEVTADSPDGNIINSGEGYGRAGVNARTYKNTDYENVVAAVEKWTSEGIKCISYQHIPMQEFFMSGIIVEDAEGDVLMDGRQPEPFAGRYYKNSVPNTVTNRFAEPCGCSYYSTEALYKAFASGGNTLAVCYGHDHTNTVMAEGTCYGMPLTQGYGGGLLVYPSDYGEDSPAADYNPMVCLYTLKGDSFTKQTMPYYTLLKDFIFGGYIAKAITDFFRNIIK